MKKIESGNFEPKDIDIFQSLQWAYAKRMVNRSLKDSFIVREVKDHRLPEPTCKDMGKRRDNDYKHVPIKADR